MRKRLTTEKTTGTNQQRDEAFPALQQQINGGTRHSLQARSSIPRWTKEETTTIAGRGIPRKQEAAFLARKSTKSTSTGGHNIPCRTETTNTKEAAPLEEMKQPPQKEEMADNQGTGKSWAIGVAQVQQPPREITVNNNKSTVSGTTRATDFDEAAQSLISKNQRNKKGDGQKNCRNGNTPCKPITDSGEKKNNTDETKEVKLFISINL